MNAEETISRVATATGVGIPVLRSVWRREASSDPGADLVTRCQRRLTDFATRGAQSQDGDLWPRSARPLTAASSLLIWDDTPVDTKGASLMELGVRVAFPEQAGDTYGTVVKSTSDSITVLATNGLHVLSPSDVTCI